jgi:hypothetical protein
LLGIRLIYRFSWKLISGKRMDDAGLVHLEAKLEKSRKNKRRVALADHEITR